MSVEDNIANKNLTQILTETMTKNFANPHGRASRREFWLFQLLIIIEFFSLGLFIVLVIFTKEVNSEDVKAFWLIPLLVLLIIIIPSICISIRRLHDIGYSGWYILLSLIPAVGLFLLILFIKPSQKGSNKYGPNPYKIDDYNSESSIQNNLNIPSYKI